MTCERDSVSGMLILTERVTDGVKTWFETGRYAGYATRTAKALFLDFIKKQGWRV